MTLMGMGMVAIAFGLPAIGIGGTRKCRYSMMALKWLPLIGLVYDHKDNSVEIALEASKRDVVDHIIREPREIYFAEAL
jgi:hypothetical protein